MSINNLFIFSILYLSIPNIIFLFGWYKLYISIPIVLILLIILYKSLKNLYPKNEKIIIQNSLLILTIILIWVTFGGSIPNIFQNPDWNKHNSIVYDLVKNKWPVKYSDGQYLIYYIGYYLPASVVGKIFGLKIAKLILFAWTSIGTILTFLWITKFTKSSSLKTLLLFIFFSGLDFIFTIFINNKIPTGTAHIENWSNIWQYSSNTTLLYWVPQHALSGWLATSLFIESINKKQINLQLVFFIFITTFIWSPFISIGILPFLPFVIKDKIKLKAILNYQNVFLFIYLILVLLFFKSTSYKSNFDFLWSKVDIFENWPKLILFYVCEIGLIIFPLIKWSKCKILKYSFVFLILLPFFKYGEFNDIVMRASIPALFICQIFFIKYVLQSKNTLIIFLIVFSALTPLLEISRSISNFNKSYTSYISLTLNPKVVLKQYLGNLNYFIFKK